MSKCMSEKGHIEKNTRHHAQVPPDAPSDESESSSSSAPASSSLPPPSAASSGKGSGAAGAKFPPVEMHPLGIAECGAADGASSALRVGTDLLGFVHVHGTARVRASLGRPCLLTVLPLSMSPRSEVLLPVAVFIRGTAGGSAALPSTAHVHIAPTGEVTVHLDGTGEVFFSAVSFPSASLFKPTPTE